MLAIMRESKNKFKKSKCIHSMHGSLCLYSATVQYPSLTTLFLTSPQYPLSLVPENRLGESMCCVIKYNLPKKEIAISLTDFTLPSCASIDVITMLFTATHCNCKNTQIVLSLGGVNDFLSDARKGKIL